MLDNYSIFLQIDLITDQMMTISMKSAAWLLVRISRYLLHVAKMPPYEYGPKNVNC